MVVQQSDDPLQSPLQYLKGVGPRRAADLERVGLHTVEDLLYRFPIRYEDRGHFQTIASLRPGVAASVVGEVVSCGVRPTRRPRFKIFELLVRDRDRLAARDLVQPAVPERRLPPAPARHPVRQARADVARPAAAEPAVRDSARRGGGRRDRGGGRRRQRHAAHRPHRPDLREDRHADDQDAARARAPRARRSCRPSCPIRCRRRSASASS